MILWSKVGWGIGPFWKKWLRHLWTHYFILVKDVGPFYSTYGKFCTLFKKKILLQECISLAWIFLENQTIFVYIVKKISLLYFQSNYVNYSSLV